MFIMRNHNLFSVILLTVLIDIILGCIFTSCHKPCNSNCSCKNFPIYTESVDSASYNWFPSGWMGDIPSLTFTETWTSNPHSGLTCIKITYNTKNTTGWAGIYWLPGNSWNGPGINVYEKFKVSDSCKFKVTFWSRGEAGGENIKFKVGGVTDGADSVDPPVEMAWTKLTTTWTEYRIDLTGKELSNFIGAFCCVVDNIHNPKVNSIIIYFDDIVYVSE